MATNYNPSVVTDGLVFALDAANPKSYPGSGTTWYDIIGNRNGSFEGATYSSNDLGSVVLDGSNDYVQIPYDSYWDSNVFGTATNFTLESWCKPAEFVNWDTIVMKWNPSLGGWYSSHQGASIWTNANGFQAVFASGIASNPGGSHLVLSYSTSTIKWYHVCFTGDGTNLILYVDGVQRAFNYVSNRTTSVTTTTHGPTFGRRQYLQGSLSSYKFYTRGLTAAEVKQNFEATRGRFGI